VRERERDRETDAVPPIIGPTGNRNPYSVCIIRNVYTPKKRNASLSFTVRPFPRLVHFRVQH